MGEQILALRRHVHARRKAVVHLQDTLQDLLKAPIIISVAWALKWVPVHGSMFLHTSAVKRLPLQPRFLAPQKPGPCLTCRSTSRKPSSRMLHHLEGGACKCSTDGCHNGQIPPGGCNGGWASQRGMGEGGQGAYSQNSMTYSMTPADHTSARFPS